MSHLAEDANIARDWELKTSSSHYSVSQPHQFPQSITSGEA